MLYELINPSDPYTMRCDDLEVAACVVGLLGEGQYSLKPCEEGGQDAWYHETFGVTLDVSFARVIAGKRAALIAALDSVVLGEPAERSVYEATLTALPPEEHRAYRERWYDTKRSSMNQIGARAWAYAERLRRQHTEEQTA